MTDRVISYAGALPRVEDFLSVGKYAMVGVGAVAESILGQSTQVAGLTVTAVPNTAVPGSAFAVNVGRGFMFSYQETDPSAYGVLGTDTATNVLKTGILAVGVDLGLTNAAPVSAGYSTNYLVSPHSLSRISIKRYCLTTMPRSRRSHSVARRTIQPRRSRHDRIRFSFR